MAFPSDHKASFKITRPTEASNGTREPDATVKQKENGDRHR